MACPIEYVVVRCGCWLVICKSGDSLTTCLVSSPVEDRGGGRTLQRIGSFKKAKQADTWA